MICEKCKKNQATIFYEETINGQSRSYSLCHDCATAMKQSGELEIHQELGTPIPFGGMTSSLFGSLFGIPEITRASKKSCPFCHATLEHFKRNGKVGCPTCYDTFKEELLGTIRSLHASVKHVGRAPAKLKKHREGQARLEELKSMLSRAIAEENFEQAATLRDEIRALEANEQGGQTNGMVS